MFEFRNSGCVVAGTFNIYIIQPHWLSEVGVVPTGANIALQQDMRSPGFRFRLPEVDDLVWNIRPDRLSVHSEQVGSNCGQPIAKVLGELPWTPVVAVGCNVSFKASLEHLHKISRLFPQEDIPEGYELEQRTWHRAFIGGARLFNMQLDITSDAIDLALNVHTEAKKKDRGIGDANRAVREACGQFLPLTDEAIQLARSILGVEIKK